MPGILKEALNVRHGAGEWLLASRILQALPLNLHRPETRLASSSTSLTLHFDEQACVFVLAPRA